jgi:hypothetical protein
MSGAASWYCGSALGWVGAPGREVHEVWRGDHDVEVVAVDLHDAELVDLGLDVEAAD